MNFVFFRVILITLLSSIGLSFLGILLANRLNLVDLPGSEGHKRHAQPMPIAGGLVIAAVLLLLCQLEGLWEVPDIGAILLPGLIVFGFGLRDDWRRLSPGVKFLGQLLAAVLMVALGVQVRIFLSPILNIGITILWVVGVTNAFNFVDSMDGLATGLAGIAASFFMLAASDSGQPDLSLFSAILLGVCAGVFYFTAGPARYFLGDSGAQFLGFVLSAVAIEYNPLGFLPVQSWFIPILLIGVPLFDTALVIISRIRRNKPIYRSNLDHTYHRFVIMGMHPNRAVLTMHFMAILLGAAAFVMLNLQPLWANALFGMILVSGILLIAYLEKWIPKN